MCHKRAITDSRAARTLEGRLYQARRETGLGLLENRSTISQFLSVFVHSEAKARGGLPFCFGRKHETPRDRPRKNAATTTNYKNNSTVQDGQPKVVTGLSLGIVGDGGGGCSDVNGGSLVAVDLLLLKRGCRNYGCCYFGEVMIVRRCWWWLMQKVMLMM